MMLDVEQNEDLEYVRLVFVEVTEERDWSKICWRCGQETPEGRTHIPVIENYCECCGTYEVCNEDGELEDDED